MAGSCSACVCREGPMEGPREDEFIFKLVWLNYRHNAAYRLCWLCRLFCAGLRLTVTQRQQECDYGSWLKRWVCWEEENNSLIYLGHWMVSSLSTTTGCEQPQLQLLADEFCKSKCSLPSTQRPEQRGSECTRLSLLRQCWRPVEPAKGHRRACN